MEFLWCIHRALVVCVVCLVIAFGCVICPLMEEKTLKCLSNSGHIFGGEVSSSKPFSSIYGDVCSYLFLYIEIQVWRTYYRLCPPLYRHFSCLSIHSVQNSSARRQVCSISCIDLTKTVKCCRSKPNAKCRSKNQDPRPQDRD